MAAVMASSTSGKRGNSAASSSLHSSAAVNALSFSSGSTAVRAGSYERARSSVWHYGRAGTLPLCAPQRCRCVCTRRLQAGSRRRPAPASEHRVMAAAVMCHLSTHTTRLRQRDALAAIRVLSEQRLPRVVRAAAHSRRCRCRHAVHACLDSGARVLVPNARHAAQVATHAATWLTNKSADGRRGTLPQAAPLLPGGGTTGEGPACDTTYHHPAVSPSFSRPSWACLLRARVLPSRVGRAAWQARARPTRPDAPRTATMASKKGALMEQARARRLRSARAQLLTGRGCTTAGPLLAGRVQAHAALARGAFHDVAGMRLPPQNVPFVVNVADARAIHAHTGHFQTSNNKHWHVRRLRARAQPAPACAQRALGGGRLLA